jgi:molybdate transport repressor ModE-like protein
MPVFSTALVALDAVAREGSIQRAAARLGLAPSAVLRQLRRLEDELGARLLDSTRRGTRLTTAGEALVAELRQWQGGLRRLRGQLMAMKGLQQGEVRLGAMDGLVDGILRDAVAAFHAAHPQIHLSIEVGGTEAGLRALLAGTLDALLAFNLPERRELRVLASWKLPFGAVIAPSHPLAGRKRLRFAECLAHRILLQDGSLAVRGMLESRFAHLFEITHPPLVTNSIQLIKALLAAGDAVAFLTPLDAMPALAEGRLVFVPVSDAGLGSESLALVEDSRRAPQGIVARLAAPLHAAIAAASARAGIELPRG